ncbi:MAG: hypothetical protein KDC13_02415 [Bacteroidetes bacterium]|nr:hypothetical protein [Bacteroidota bacterium]
MSLSRYKLLLILISLSAEAFSQANSPVIHQTQSVKFKDHSVPDKVVDLKNKETLESDANRDVLSRSRVTSPGENEVSLNLGASLINQRNQFLTNDGLILRDEQRTLEAAAQQIGSGNDYESQFALLRINRNRSDAENYLRKAAAMRPSDALLQLETAWVAERVGKTKERNQAAKLALNSGLVSPVLVQQAKWMASSAGNGGIIITNGENDTYPFWTLGDIGNYSVISLQFINEPDYLNQKLKEAGINSQVSSKSDPDELIQLLKKSGKRILISWAVHPDYLTKWRKNLYAAGPGLVLSDSAIDNIELLRSFYSNQDIRTYIQNGAWIHDTFAAGMANLLPGIDILLTSGNISDIEKNAFNDLKAMLLSNLQKAGVHGR